MFGATAVAKVWRASVDERAKSRRDDGEI